MFRSTCLAILLFSMPAWSCVISQTESLVRDPRPHYERAQFVVLGTVVKSEKAGRYLDRVELDVQRTFKRASSEPKTVFLNFMGSDCSQPLESGRQYLIFARLQSEAHDDQYMVIALTGEDAQEVIDEMNTWTAREK